MAYSYWIEDLNTLYIKLSIPYDENTIRFLSIKKTPGYSPDETILYDFYDFFDATTIDTTKWDYGGTITVDSGYAHLNPGKLKSKITFSNYYIVEIKMKVSSLTTDWVGFGLVKEDDSFGYFIGLRNDGKVRYYKYENGTYTDITASWADYNWNYDEWVTLEIVRNGYTTEFRFNGDSMDFVFQYGLEGNMYIHIPRFWGELTDGAGDVYIDYVKVKPMTYSYQLKYKSRYEDQDTLILACYNPGSDINDMAVKFTIPDGFLTSTDESLLIEDTDPMYTKYIYIPNSQPVGLQGIIRSNATWYLDLNYKKLVDLNGNQYDYTYDPYDNEFIIQIPEELNLVPGEVRTLMFIDEPYTPPGNISGPFEWDVNILFSCDPLNMGVSFVDHTINVDIDNLLITSEVLLTNGDSDTTLRELTATEIEQLLWSLQQKLNIDGLFLKINGIEYKFPIISRTKEPDLNIVTQPAIDGSIEYEVLGNSQKKYTFEIYVPTLQQLQILEQIETNPVIEAKFDEIGDYRQCIVTDFRYNRITVGHYVAELTLVVL